jgi:hypothetical protein
VQINNNGSHFAGGGPDSVETLLDRLQNYALDPTWESYGNFVSGDLGDEIGPEYRGLVRVFGNFCELSAGFSIDGTPEEVRPIVDAIRANQARRDYKEARDARRARLDRQSGRV